MTKERKSQDERQTSLAMTHLYAALKLECWTYSATFFENSTLNKCV